MAQKKLLFILKLFVLSFAADLRTFAAHADNCENSNMCIIKGKDDLNYDNKDSGKDNELWVRNLNEQALSATLQNLMDLAERTQIYGEDYYSNDGYDSDSGLSKSFNNRLLVSDKLMVFVSSSMPVSVLQTYVKEGGKYNAILVFKGLPDNSFKSLANLVKLVQEEGSKNSMQIDEEAFDRYKVTEVPVIVLSKEENGKLLESSKLTFDKIRGNIGIKAALHKFSEQGELKDLAQELLLQKDAM